MATKQRRWIFRSLATVAGLALSVMVGLWFYLTSIGMLPSDHLEFLQRIEHDDPQHSAATLAILGRDHELSTVLQSRSAYRSTAEPIDQRELSSLSLVPWRKAISQIAANNQIVFIAEGHLDSREREFIGAALHEFSRQGFTQYAAEALSFSTGRLRRRSFPEHVSGYYIGDPAFGNTLRTALDLRMEVIGYDYRQFSHETREEYAATRLAKFFNSPPIQENNPKNKLLIHSGPGHALKYATGTGEDWLAARLWQKTNIEPFTICQISQTQSPEIFQQLSKSFPILSHISEPMLLEPLANEGKQIAGLPVVDAAIIHPISKSVAPANRTALFPAAFRSIPGSWTGQKWPVVIGAWSPNEPTTAIAFDQVMLRLDEQRFNVHVPTNQEFEIRVFDTQGIIEITQTRSESGDMVVSPK